MFSDWICTSVASIALALSIACGAPRAALIEGDIREQIDQGVAEGTANFDHDAWDALLKRYVRMDGRRFDYAGLKSEERAFDDYLSAVASAELTRLSGSEIEALFINAYNAYTIRTVLDHVSEDGTFDIASIRDIDDVFGQKRHVVGGFLLSLDNIEHNILRPIFRDPRLHFSVNCASISCPPISTDAFSGESIDDQLERVTRNALQNPDYVAVENDTLVLTKILEWYGEDFTNPQYRGSERSLATFVGKYATSEVRDWIDTRENEVPTRFREYDWRLNRPDAPTRGAEP
jgi:hypothetical protein